MTSVLAPMLGVADTTPHGLTEEEPRGLALAAGAMPSPGPARSIAAEIWDRLNDRERLLFPHLTEPVRRQGEVIGTGHTQAAVAARRLRDRFRVLLDGEDQLTQQEIMGHLLEVQAGWARRRPHGPDNEGAPSVGDGRMRNSGAPLGLDETLTNPGGCSIVSHQGDIPGSQPRDIPSRRPRERAPRVIERLKERSSLSGTNPTGGQNLLAAIEYHRGQLETLTAGDLDNAVIAAEEFLNVNR
jgi:hypothetical protein